MKTAVEKLVEEINKLTGLTIQMDEPCVQQAKAIEREQIIEAWNTGTYAYNNGEEYYKETFNPETNESI